METAGDLDGIARLGQDLVGMTGHLGLARLSAAVAGMNRAAREDAATQVMPEIGEVQRLGVDSIEAMRRHLDGIMGR